MNDVKNVTMEKIRTGMVLKIKSDHPEGKCEEPGCVGMVVPMYMRRSRLVTVRNTRIATFSLTGDSFSWTPCMFEYVTEPSTRSTPKKTAVKKTPLPLLKVGDIVNLKGKTDKGIITKITPTGKLIYVKFGKVTAKPSRHRASNIKLDTNKSTAEGKINFDSVIIQQEKVDQIKEAISQREYSGKIFDDWGFADVFEKGTAVSLLFYGMPGTGKTLMAQAIADYLDLPLEIIGAAEIQTSEPGGAERKIKSIFAKAKAIITGKPVEGAKEKVILLDECDSLLMDRNQVGHIMSSQINTLLSEIEQFKGIVIFTTNRLGRLDPALERRITSKIQFDFPNKEARQQIWERMMPLKAPLAEDVNFKKLAEYPLTGGNIKNCVLNAARRAAHKKLDVIDQNSFLQAIEQEIQSVTDFAAQKELSYTQGGMVASRDYDVVHGRGGMAIRKVNKFMETIKENRKTK